MYRNCRAAVCQARVVQSGAAAEVTAVAHQLLAVCPLLQQVVDPAEAVVAGYLQAKGSAK